MIWLLISLVTTTSGAVIAEQSIHESMMDCFDEREHMVEEIGRPIIDYQIVCIPTTRIKML